MTNKEAVQHLKSMMNEPSPTRLGIFRRAAIAKAILALDNSPEIPDQKLTLVVSNSRLAALECNVCHNIQSFSDNLVCSKCGSTDLGEVKVDGKASTISSASGKSQ